MSAKPEKTEKEIGTSHRGGPEGFISGILPVQEELRRFIGFFITFVLVGKDYLKEEADRIAARYQAERGNMNQNDRVNFSLAFGEYVRGSQEMTRLLGRLAIAKMAMDALHDLIDIEDDPEKRALYHRVKIEVMLKVMRILVALLRELNKMSEALKRAEALLP